MNLAFSFISNRVLDLEVINGRGINILVMTVLHSAPAIAALRIIDLEVDAGIILGADDLEQSADRLRGLSLAADDIAHVSRVDLQGQKDAPFIDGPVDHDVVRVADDRLDDGL